MNKDITKHENIYIHIKKNTLYSVWFFILVMVYAMGITEQFILWKNYPIPWFFVLETIVGVGFAIYGCAEYIVYIFNMMED